MGFMSWLLDVRLRLVGWLGYRPRILVSAIALIALSVVVTVLAMEESGGDQRVLVGAAVTLAMLVVVVTPRIVTPQRRRRVVAGAPTARSSADLLLLDYAALARRRGRTALVATLERTRSVPGREILAFLASNGTYSVADIVSTLDDYRDPALRAQAGSVLSTLHDRWLVELARLLVIQGATVQQVLTGADLYGLVVDKGGMAWMGRDHERCYAEALIACGRRDDAAAMVSAFPSPTELDLRLRAEACNPFRAGGNAGDEDAWLALVNTAFALDGLEPVSVEPDTLPVFDRLTSAAMTRVPSPHSVTVVITSFRPDESLLTSVRSAIASSWSNLAVLVIDDASGPGYEEIYRAATAIDPRVRVETLGVNGGTYVGRNHALATVDTEFITFQDSDDWMHPRRIERQVEQLLAEPSLLANTSRSVRVTEDLEFSHHRSMEAKVCEPSLMLRRAEVIGLIGYFDRVRKNGDTEYRRRLEAVTGAPTPVVGEVPLTWQRTVSGSLSYADVGRSWISPARRAYMNCAAAWHRQIATDGVSPFLAASAEREAPFYAPPEMRGLPQGRRHFDVVFLSNWLVVGSHGGSQRSNEEEVIALVDAGLRVAISHIEAFWFMHGSRSALSERVIALLGTGRIELVQLDSDITADLLVIRYPPVLQFATPARSAITAATVLIVANQAPLDSDGSGRRYDVDTVSARALEIFGVEASWAPQGPIMREILSRSVAGPLLHHADMPAILDVDSWAVQRRDRAGRLPIVGRYSRDHASKWPTTPAGVLAVYASDGFVTRVMGGPETLTAVFGDEPVPERWVVLAEGEQPTREFLAEIDFFVYFHAENYREAFGRSIVEAMASGCVVILQRSFEPVFGDAAVYCDPAEVEGIVAALYADPDGYAAQAQRGFDYLHRNSSHPAYVSRVRHLLSSNERLPTLA